MSCLVQNNRTCNFFDCSDTPLSISGNVISILTFFVAAIATYYAFFSDIRDITQSADDYSNDIRSLHDQLWTVGDIHAQLAKLLANNEKLRISDVALQSRLQQGQSESLKEARKFLDDYSAAYQKVFTNYFKRHRWVVRIKWLLLQRKVAHFKSEASELRNMMTLDLLAITLNMNISLQHTLHQRDLQTEKLAKQIDTLSKAITGGKVDFDQEYEEPKRPDSPSPSIMMDPTEMNPPTFVFSPPEDTDLSSTEPPGMRSPSRSPSPFSTRRPLEGSLSNDT